MTDFIDSARAAAAYRDDLKKEIDEMSEAREPMKVLVSRCEKGGFSIANSQECHALACIHDDGAVLFSQLDHRIRASLRFALGILESLYFNNGTLSAGRPEVETEMGLTDRMEHICDMAMAYAKELGHKALGPEHLLLAILAEEGNVAGAVLANRAPRNIWQEDIQKLLGQRIPSLNPVNPAFERDKYRPYTPAEFHKELSERMRRQDMFHMLQFKDNRPEGPVAIKAVQEEGFLTVKGIYISLRGACDTMVWYANGAPFGVLLTEEDNDDEDK